MIYDLSLAGKPPDDDVQLALLKMKPNMKIMMMGTREEELVSNLLRKEMKWNVRIGLVRPSVCPSVLASVSPCVRPSGVQISETTGCIFLMLGVMIDLCAPSMAAILEF